MFLKGLKYTMYTQDVLNSIFNSASSQNKPSNFSVKPNGDFKIIIDKNASPYDSLMPYTIEQMVSKIFGEKKIEFSIENVIFNNPATVVYWKDKTKTIVKCQDGDEYNKEIGLAMCIIKKVCGNKGNYNDVFERWCK